MTARANDTIDTLLWLGAGLLADAADSMRDLARAAWRRLAGHGGFPRHGRRSFPHGSSGLPQRRTGRGTTTLISR
jgi:hypothetical protein